MPYRKLSTSKTAVRFVGTVLGWGLLGGSAVANPAASEAVQGEAEPMPTVEIGSADWRPYFYGGRTEGPRGSAVEMFELCLPRFGYRPRFVPATVDEIFAGLKSGRFQVHVLSYRPERAEFLLYGEEPMFYSGYRPFVRPGFELPGTAPADLDGLTVALRTELRLTEELDAYFQRRLDRNDGIVVVHSDPDALRAVAEGRADVAFLMVSPALRHRRRLGLEQAVDVLMSEDLKTAGYRVAVSRTQTVIEDPERFLADIDTCLRDLKESGQYDEIGDRYADLIE